VFGATDKKNRKVEINNFGKGDGESGKNPGGGEEIRGVGMFPG